MKDMEITDTAGARLSINPELIQCVAEDESGTYIVLSRPPIRVDAQADELAQVIGAWRKRACPVRKAKKKEGEKP